MNHQKDTNTYCIPENTRKIQTDLNRRTSHLLVGQRGQHHGRRKKPLNTCIRIILDIGLFGLPPLGWQHTGLDAAPQVTKS